MNRPKLTDADYERLLAFRDGLRRFLKWSADQASAIGLTPSQHQILLIIRGHAGGPPTIGDIADHLMIRPHSAVELVDRCEHIGLIQRVEDQTDHRVVRVRLTPIGEEHLASLSELHVDELASFGSQVEIWADPPRTSR